MKVDEIKDRLKNALIYGTSHPEAYMTKADELWEKYSSPRLEFMSKREFLAALQEYGELVKAEAVKVCHTVESVKWNMHLSGKPTTLKCSDAIKEMKLP